MVAMTYHTGTRCSADSARALIERKTSGLGDERTLLPCPGVNVLPLYSTGANAVPAVTQKHGRGQAGESLEYMEYQHTDSAFQEHLEIVILCRHVAMQHHEMGAYIGHGSRT